VERIEPALLKEVVRRLVTALQPERIYLYGSHAYGKPHKDSDVDLFVVVADGQPHRTAPTPTHRKSVEAYRALRGLFIPAEIKVVTNSEFERRSRWLSSIERVVEEKGKVLYESPAG